MTNVPYGYCGMPCALCSRYRTNGSSRCAGCSAGGYYTDVCKVFRCCRDKALIHCGSCPVFPCERLGKMGDFRDLSTGHVKQRTCAAIADGGFDAWFAEYAEKAALLTTALEKYNTGRMKRYLCELFIRNDAGVLRSVMERAEALEPASDRPAAFRALAEELRTDGEL